MIPAFERAKSVHALDRAVTVIGHFTNTAILNQSFSVYPICYYSFSFNLFSKYPIPGLEGGRLVGWNN
jgi:hypothetical protein